MQQIETFKYIFESFPVENNQRKYVNLEWYHITSYYARNAKGNVQQIKSIDMHQINPSIHFPAPDDSLLAGYFSEFALITLSLSILLGLGISTNFK